MADPHVARLIRLIVEYTTPNGQALNVLHFSRDPSLTVSDALGFVMNEFVQWWEGFATTNHRLRQWTSNNVTLVQLRAIDWSVAGGAEQTDTTFASPAGIGGNSAPADLSVVISWKTGLSGRSNRGRMYSVMPPQGMITSTGFVDNTMRGLMQNGANEFIANCITALVPLVVYSRKGLGGTVPVTTATIDSHFDVQRRRGN